MKYVDIFSNAISHFTNIPEEFVRGYLENFVQSQGFNAELLDYILEIEFPEIEGAILLQDLKSGNLESTVNLFSNSFKVIQEEEQRQAMVN